MSRARATGRSAALLAGALAAPALFGACGGDSTSPDGGGGDTPRVYAVISPATDTLLVHQTLTFSAWTQDSTGRRYGGSATWSVSDTTTLRLAAATISTATGTAVGAGTVTVTASVGGYVAHATVRVRPIFTVLPRLPSLFVGDTLLLVGWNEDGRGPAAVPVQASFVAGATGVLGVTAAGVVTGLQVGVAAASALYQGESTAVEVAVLPRPAGVNRELSYRCGVPTGRLCVAGTSRVDTVSLFGGAVEEYAWSPDGSRLAIAYSVVPAGQQPGIYLSGPDGSGATLLVAGGRAPDWSPDGARIAFEGSDTHVWTVPATSGAAVRLTFATGQETGPVWSPDGRQIAFSRDGKLWLAPVAGGAAVRSVSLPFVPAGALWSPDGKYLGLTSAFSSSGSVQPYGVWVVAQDGAIAAHAASGNCASDGTCVAPDQLLGNWAPDADRLVWFTLAGGPPGADQFVIVAHRDGTEISRFRTASCCGWYVLSSPSWSPDGTSIAYFALSAADSTVTELRVASPDGSGARFVAVGPGSALRWRR